MIWISISISFRYFRGICRRQRQFILPKSQWPFPASFLDHAKSREISILRVANSRRRNRFLLRRGVTKKRWAMETIGNSDLVIYYWKVYCKLSVYVLLCLINKPQRAVSIRTVLCTQSPHKKNPTKTEIQNPGLTKIYIKQCILNSSHLHTIYFYYYRLLNEDIYY